MSRPLSWRAESRRQWRRRRTLWVLGILLALPLIMVGAFSLDSGHPNRGSSRPVDLATSSGANFTVFTLLVSSELLLVIVGALFVGDPIPAEASWATLRYLLTAPVSRGRLLTSKLVVGYLSIAAAMILLPVWALVVGTIAYGTEPFTMFGGGQLSWGVFIPRLLIAVGYLFVSVMSIAAVAFWVGVRTDTPLAAVGGALVVLIVASILDGIDALGHWRNALPGHYSRAWIDLFSTGINWADMRHGVAWSLLYTVLFLALGFRHFRRKDVLS